MCVHVYIYTYICIVFVYIVDFTLCVFVLYAVIGLLCILFCCGKAESRSYGELRIDSRTKKMFSKLFQQMSAYSAGHKLLVVYNTSR